MDQDARQGRLEIFEAGTGHGSLTLHLARAVSGANGPAPPSPWFETSPPSVTEGSGEDSSVESVDDAFKSTIKSILKESVEEFQKYTEWLTSRKAVIHSLDISKRYSNFAQGVVRNFRNGLYYPNIDFHVGTIEDFVSKRREDSSEPFLDHAFLDLPGCHAYLKVLGDVLKPNGTLMVFCPSITQIITCIQRVADDRLPLVLEQTLELGNGGATGGREWDVRAVKPRALLKAEVEARKKVAGEMSEDAGSESLDDGSEGSSRDQDSGWTMVCRPKVGGMINGGGFLGVWKKMA